MWQSGTTHLLWLGNWKRFLSVPHSFENAKKLNIFLNQNPLTQHDSVWDINQTVSVLGNSSVSWTFEWHFNSEIKNIRIVMSALFYTATLRLC